MQPDPMALLIPPEDPWDEETKAKQSALYFCGHGFAPTSHRCFPIAALTRVGAHPSERFPAQVMFPDACLIVAVIFSSSNYCHSIRPCPRVRC